MALTGKATESGSASYIDNAVPTTLLTNAQGANLIQRLDKLLLINVSVAAVQYNLYKVPSGGIISGDDYKIAKANADAEIAAGETLDVREVAGVILENGDSLRAMCSAATALRFDLSYWAES